MNRTHLSDLNTQKHIVCSWGLVTRIIRLLTVRLDEIYILWQGFTLTFYLFQRSKLWQILRRALLFFTELSCWWIRRPLFRTLCRPPRRFRLLPSRCHSTASKQSACALWTTWTPSAAPSSRMLWEYPWSPKCSSSPFPKCPTTMQLTQARVLGWDRKCCLQTAL